MSHRNKGYFTFCLAKLLICSDLAYGGQFVAAMRHCVTVKRVKMWG